PSFCCSTTSSRALSSGGPTRRPCSPRHAPAAWSISTATAWQRPRRGSPRATRCCGGLGPGKMPRFHYRALRGTGGEIAGELVAATERDAAQRLQALGSYPIEIATAAGRRVMPRTVLRGRRLPGSALVLFTRQLATLLAAGVALDRSLVLV